VRNVRAVVDAAGDRLVEVVDGVRPRLSVVVALGVGFRKVREDDDKTTVGIGLDRGRIGEIEIGEYKATPLGGA